MKMLLVCCALLLCASCKMKREVILLPGFQDCYEPDHVALPIYGLHQEDSVRAGDTVLAVVNDNFAPYYYDIIRPIHIGRPHKF